MKRLGLATAVLIGLASMSMLMSAQDGPSSSGSAAPAIVSTGVPPGAPATFQKYCFECHGSYKPEAGLSLERLLTMGELGPHSEAWEKVADALESEVMPPVEALDFPSDEERAATAAWIRTSLKTWADAHAGDPGRVTVRRLTSAEYAYAIEDLTGVKIRVGIDASSDSVGGEGFSNFGDVQFVQDATIERYLEAAKVVADHAVIGSGPIEFYTDPGRTGMELAALARVNAIHAARGFRVVSGEGGRPFGLERYGKAFFVAWYYQHRAALGDPDATIHALAEREGISGRFADHIWSVVHRDDLGYPARMWVARWRDLPKPTREALASIEAARAATDKLSQDLTTWPSWFFARGDLAAGGAGDESPLAFSDATLRVQPARQYSYLIGPRPARGRGPAAPPGPTTVHLTFANMNPTPGVAPTIIWRNARVVTRAAPAGRGGGAPAGRGGGGPVLAEQPLRTVLPAEAAAALAFGASPDGTAMGENDFATQGPVSFTLDAPIAPGTVVQLEADAELGADRSGVVRVMISNLPDGSFRDVNTRVVFADPSSDGYRAYRTGMAEYAALLPPNSHGEANPSDKDPVPLPFDSTYNVPEHDAFVNNVKYQRTDEFVTEFLLDGDERVELDHAWNNLFGSWPYHNAYLDMLAAHYSVDLKGWRIADMTPENVATLPAEMQQYVTPLRAHYDEVAAAMVRAEPGHIEDVLAFASRAWRRPLADSERDRLRAFYRTSRTVNELDHDDAVRAVMARVLVSPAFLYRLETVDAEEHAGETPLDGWEMASRLSFFLWSSIPDDELRRAAAAGELSDTDKLAAQVRRMTADPKARRIATEFFGQWLGFYRFDEFRGVDTTRFPEFTEAVQDAMYDESVATFDYLVRENRPLGEMLHADYTFLNKPLAAFYGIDAAVPDGGGAVVKVDGANAFDRGGMLRLGSVLTTTSAPLRTSPVKRGDWVLRRILGTPTPPPPADAGSLPSDPKAFGGLTLRERLNEHKRNATCANCHLRIDPLGFPLERFDAVGRTRATYDDGTPVDDTGEFADKSTIAGADGLLGYLDSREAQVMKTFSKKMIGYALGRTVMASDNPLIDDMIAAGSDAAFADLAVKVVTSRQFRNHQGRGAQ